MKQWFLARYLLEQSLLVEEMIVYKPSLLAASAMFLADRSLNREEAKWTADLIAHTTYTKSALMTCATEMRTLAINFKNCRPYNVRRKFSLGRYE